MLAMPKTSGWCVVWYTGVEKISKRGKLHRFLDSYECGSRPEALAKVKELKKKGLEIEGIYECVF